MTRIKTVLVALVLVAAGLFVSATPAAAAGVSRISCLNPWAPVMLASDHSTCWQGTGETWVTLYDVNAIYANFRTVRVWIGRGSRWQIG